MLRRDDPRERLLRSDDEVLWLSSISLLFFIPDNPCRPRDLVGRDIDDELSTFGSCLASLDGRRVVGCRRARLELRLLPPSPLPLDRLDVTLEPRLRPESLRSPNPRIVSIRVWSVLCAGDASLPLRCAEELRPRSRRSRGFAALDALWYRAMREFVGVDAFAILMAIGAFLVDLVRWISASISSIEKFKELLEFINSARRGSR